MRRRHHDWQRTEVAGSRYGERCRSLESRLGQEQQQRRGAVQRRSRAARSLQRAELRRRHLQQVRQRYLPFRLVLRRESQRWRGVQLARRVRRKTNLRLRDPRARRGLQMPRRRRRVEGRLRLTLGYGLCASIKMRGEA